MKRIVFVFLISAPVILPLSGCSYNYMKNKIFNGIDLNSDGYITFNEYKKLPRENTPSNIEFIRKEFNDLDKNRDGKIYPQEFK